MKHEKIQHRTYDPEKVKKNFAGVSASYDYWAKATESKAAERVLALTDVKEKGAILEVGVGTGLLFEQIVQQNRTGFTAGIDLSSAMIRKTNDRTASLREERSFWLREASAYKLPFQEHQFNCLISTYTLDLLPADDFAEILREFKRVLKPDGRLVLASMTFGWKWYHHIWEWIARTFPRLMTDCRPVDLEPFVNEAGFRINKTETISQNTFPSQIIKATES